MTIAITNELGYVETPIGQTALESSAALEAYFIELTSAGAPWFDEG